MVEFGVVFATETELFLPPPRNFGGEWWAEGMTECTWRVRAGCRRGFAAEYSRSLALVQSRRAEGRVFKAPTYSSGANASLRLGTLLIDIDNDEDTPSVAHDVPSDTRPLLNHNQ